MRTQVFSYGGGVQSVAICALIRQGRLPRPDYIVISDTGYEKGSTWRYLESVTAPALAEIGLEITRIDRRKYEAQEYIQIYSGGKTVGIPAHSKDSKSRGFCSDKWKKYPIRRWMREQGITQADVWIGFSADEQKRIRLSDVAWAQFAYPLLGGLFGGPGNEIVNRRQCLEIIGSMGWPLPPKSSCYICPHMRDSEWQELTPSEFEDACRIDAEIRHAAEDGYEKYLHRSCRPLCEVDFSDPDLTLELPGCTTGMCFV